MKRALSLLLMLALCFTLFACESTGEEMTEHNPGISESTNAVENNTATKNTESAKSTESTESAETVHIHTWKNATCSAPKICSACGATEGSVKNHTWKDATCTAAKTCTSCGVTEGSAKNHTWKDATYTAPKTCTGCGATEGDPIEVPEKENYHGHVYTGGETSKKYHYEANCAGKNSHEITWEEVERRNLGPCGTCVLK